MRTPKLLTLFLFFAFSLNSFAQVAINSTGVVPDGSSMLDVSSASMGILIPRVALTASNAAGPVTLPQTSLLVYNTATASSGATLVYPGYYYNAGTTGAPNWVRVLSNKDAWNVIGNYGTDPAINYLGTSDAQDFLIKTNNIDKIRIKTDAAGTHRIGVGTNFPTSYPAGAGNTSTLLHVYDGETNATDFGQIQIGANKTTATNKVGELNFHASVNAADRRTASIESYVTAVTGVPNLSGDLRFFTNNSVTALFSEKMRIQSDGNVGIGTTTPAAQLHTTGTVRFANYPSGVNGAVLKTNASGDLSITNFTGSAGDVLLGTGAFGTAVTSGSAWQLLGNAGTLPATNFIGTTDAQDLVFRTNNTEKMRVLSGGNVGIGTTTPDNKVHIVGSNSALRLEGTGGWGSLARITFGDINRVYIEEDIDDYLTIYGLNRTAIMGGNVGIGTTSPTRKLEVNGDIKLAYGYQVYLGENVSANGKIGINFHTDADPNYGIYKPAGAWTQPLHIGFYTGVKIGANSAYGGTKFYNSSDMATEIMSVGNGDNHVRVGGYLFAQYLNSTDNSVANGVTGVMVKQGDNYYRTGTADAIKIFLNGNGNGWIENQYAGAQAANYWISGESRTGGWFRNSTSGTGLYNETNGRHFYSENGSYWSLTTGNGLIFRDAYASTIQGYIYNDGTNFGILHRGGGWGFGTSTARAFVAQPLMVNGTGSPSYALHTLGDIYANGGWLRVSGNQGLYYESWGGGFYMSDGDYIRTYAPSDITGIDINGPLNIGGWNATYRVNAGWYIGADPLIAPTTDYWGYVGAYANPNWVAWFEMNAYDYWNISKREEKHDIYSINDDDALTDLVMEDIDKIKPSFYRYNKEKDTFDGNDTKYKPQMHLGVIADESPDYILGQTYDKVNIYGVATMSLVGVKQNRKEIKEIKDFLNLNSENINVQDFGTSILNGTEVWVNFSDNFSQKISDSNIPVITVTSGNSLIQLSVVEKNQQGFKVKTHTPVSDLSFDWIAITKTQTSSFKSQSDSHSSRIPSSLYERLRVPESTKNTMINFYKNIKINDKSSEIK